jgi:hypothetical protein
MEGFSLINVEADGGREIIDVGKYGRSQQAVSF